MSWRDDSKIQGVIVGAIGAVMNRLCVMFGIHIGWTPFHITMLIEILLPFICTYVICWLLRQSHKDCFITSCFASAVGAITTLLTINWD